MLCPYCKSEMEVGNLETECSPGLFYIPCAAKDVRFYTSGSVLKRNGIILDGPHLTKFNRTKVLCCVCKKCKKIIISYR